MHHVTLEEAVAQLPALLQEARQGEEVIIEEHSHPVVKLVLMRPEERSPQSGGAEGLPKIPDHNHEPAGELNPRKVEDIKLAANAAVEGKDSPGIHHRKPRQPGSARGLITMVPDFDAPLDDFAEYQ